MHRLKTKCKWCCIFLVLMFSIAIYYDIQINGQGIFKESATGKVLTSAGVLPHLHRGCNAVMIAGARVIKCYEKYVGPYVAIFTQMFDDLWHQAMSDACSLYEWVEGFFDASWTLSWIIMDQYAPHMSKKLKAFTWKAMESYNQTAAILEDNFQQMIRIAGKCNKEFHKNVDEYAKRQLFEGTT